MNCEEVSFGPTLSMVSSCAADAVQSGDAHLPDNSKHATNHVEVKGTSSCHQTFPAYAAPLQFRPL